MIDLTELMYIGQRFRRIIIYCPRVVNRKADLCLRARFRIVYRYYTWYANSCDPDSEKHDRQKRKIISRKRTFRRRVHVCKEISEHRGGYFNVRKEALFSTRRVFWERRLIMTHRRKIYSANENNVVFFFSTSSRPLFELFSDVCASQKFNFSYLLSSTFLIMARSNKKHVMTEYRLTSRSLKDLNKIDTHTYDSCWKTKSIGLIRWFSRELRGGSFRLDTDCSRSRAGGGDRDTCICWRPEGCSVVGAGPTISSAPRYTRYTRTRLKTFGNPQLARIQVCAQHSW